VSVVTVKTVVDTDVSITVVPLVAVVIVSEVVVVTVEAVVLVVVFSVVRVVVSVSVVVKVVFVVVDVVDVVDVVVIILVVSYATRCRPTLEMESQSRRPLLQGTSCSRWTLSADGQRQGEFRSLRGHNCWQDSCASLSSLPKQFRPVKMRASSVSRS
jgi:hypothetical protein